MHKESLNQFEEFPKKKQLVTLSIGGNYLPNLTKYTLPLLKHYADKCSADFRIITEEKFKMNPKSGHGGEKFQLYELSEGYDWTIFVDADALINPDTPDWTEMVSKAQVVFHGVDMYLNRFKPNAYTRRSGQLCGACTWFTCFSDWTRDLWHPPEISWEEAMSNIQPILQEQKTGLCSKEHLIDDYIVTQNIHRYGLKVVTVLGDLIQKCPNNYFLHLYNVEPEKKIVEIKQQLANWGVTING